MVLLRYQPDHEEQKTQGEDAFRWLLIAGDHEITLIRNVSIAPVLAEDPPQPWHVDVVGVEQERREEIGHQESGKADQSGERMEATIGDALKHTRDPQPGCHRVEGDQQIGHI